MDELAALGFIEGENLNVRRVHAQAEMINIRPMLQNLDSLPLDAIVTFTTPVLQGAATAVKQHPVVFTYVTDPIAAGVGSSFDEHLPHLTGIGSMPPLKDTLRLTKRLIPNLKRIGTLYNSGEANSVKEITVFSELCSQNGIEVIALTAASSSEVLQGRSSSGQ